MLTPMSKYYCSEMCNTVAYDAIQVLGGSGYMRDYASERHARDARITTIYEGTSQLQVVAAVRGVCGGTAEKYLEDLASLNYADSVKDLLALLAEGTRTLMQVCRLRQGTGRRLYGPVWPPVGGYGDCPDQRLSVLRPGLQQGPDGRGGGRVRRCPDAKENIDDSAKMMMARWYITRNAALIKAWAEEVQSGDKSAFREYEMLVGPVPEIG